MKRIAIVWSLAALLVLAGCSAVSGGETVPPQPELETVQEEGGDGPGSLTDMTGHTVTLHEPVTRAVALTAADCEIIYALGAQEVLVGRGEYCDYPAEVFDIPSVQSGEEMNVEQIIALEPQVVFMGTMAQSLEQVAALEAVGIPVVNSDAMDIEGVYAAIEMIGDALQRNARADALVEEMRGRFAALEERVPRHEENPSVYFEISPLEWGLWTAGEGTFMDEISGLLGVRNIFGDVSGWAEISQEQVLERNPDYIFTVAMRFDDGPPPEEEILGRSGWQGVTAVEKGRIYNVDSDEFARPGPRLADAAELLFQLIYEEE